MERVATLGEKRVRVGFNPSGEDRVSEIKLLTAKLIDISHTLQKEAIDANDMEHARVAAIAMTSYEEAAMWAVKAAT